MLERTKKLCNRFLDALERVMLYKIEFVEPIDCCCCHKRANGRGNHYVVCAFCGAVHHPWCYTHNCHPSEEEVNKLMWQREHRAASIKRNLKVAAASAAFAFWFMDSDK